jgi:hypothetical protein
MEAPLRRHILSAIQMKGAHLSFLEAVSDFPAKLRGKKVRGAPHTAWQLLEHMRLAQQDILDFSRNPDYQERKFPDDYWPATTSPPGEEAWDKSLRQFVKDLQAMQSLVAKEKDLFGKIPHGQGQTLLREALLLADHNSYHLGQLVFLRKMLEA